MSKEAASQLEELLGRETAELEALTGLLEQERDALARSDVDSLLGIVDKKSRSTAVLEQIESQRLALLQAVNQQNITDFIEYNPGDNTSLASAWFRFTRAAEACQRLNQINGMAMMQYRQHVARMMAILAGQSGNENTYGPDGSLDYAASGKAGLKA
ncbi:MAG: flagellar protein FlgN [Gammaproteobacteria bacterium]|nr:flagellar protein FlgN [Gammaproteobacteria bacterium]